MRRQDEHLRRLQTMHPNGKRHSAQPSVPCRAVNQGLRKGCTCALRGHTLSGQVITAASMMQGTEGTCTLYGTRVHAMRHTLPRSAETGP